MPSVFIEIGHQNDTADHERKRSQEDYLIDCYVTTVHPSNCSNLLKRVSKLTPKDERLSHLRRVKKPRTLHQHNDPDGEEPANKKVKKNGGDGGCESLEVVLAVASEEDRQQLEPITQEFSLELEIRKLPARSAESKEELNIWNNMWPTIYFHERSAEHKKKQRELTPEEVALMEKGIQLAIEDAKAAAPNHIGGAVMLCPETGDVISRAADERKLQGQHRNPLSTPTVLAIQGVSRREREAALGHGMESNAFKNGRYLCTGFDLYITGEPDVYEAMALVHSRIRRVTFGVVNSHEGGLGGSGAPTSVHGLSGTNHHYRAFRCDNGHLLDECKMIHKMD